MTPKPILLIILDGWGYREDPHYNAILAAKTPNWDEFWQHYPHTIISSSGSDVGLPRGQMGNSEVGHLHMGAGRLVPQDLMRIDTAIEDGSFFTHPALVEAAIQTKRNNSSLHIIGLLSPGGVHSHENHIQAMLRLAAAQGVDSVYLHAILDGRDTPPRSALSSIAALEKETKELGVGKIVTIIGRYFAMDRDKRWERTQKAYDLYTLGTAAFNAETAADGLELAYERGENDEFVQATTIHLTKKSPVTIKDDDVIVFMNFRADRARQLTRAFTEKDFNSFPRGIVPSVQFITLTRYAADINTQVAYPPLEVKNSIGEIVSNAGLTQLRIAETEKYAHVTFFFNGGREAPFTGEDRILIPSPKVATYDLKPEMSARELTDKLVEDILATKHDLIICNFANPDMVGHSGNMVATIKAIEVIDECLGRIVKALKTVGGEMIITADHGNAELMFDEVAGQPQTAHTANLVPFLYIGRKAKINPVEGTLIDIAPTLLYLLNLKIPDEMKGHTLVQLGQSSR